MFVKTLENDTNVLKICMCCVLPTGENIMFSESVYLYIHPMTGLSGLIHGCMYDALMNKL